MRDNPRRRRRAVALLGTIAATAALVLGAPSGAYASDSTDDDNVTLSPAASSYADGATVSVSVSGLAASTEYTVGICEYVTYSMLGAKIPACNEDSQIDVTSSASGVVSVSGYELISTGSNAHWFLLGQPSTVDCATKLCEVVVSPTHGGGSGGTYRGDSAEFHVS